MNLPKRKSNRLKDYDYTQSGYYFITICTKNKECILCKICRGEQCSPETTFALSNIGKITDISINNISKNYPNIKIDNYVIMPNHIHIILIIIDEEDSQIDGRTLFAPTIPRAIKQMKEIDEIGTIFNNPTIPRVIKQMKEYVTKQIGFTIWQKSYHDHIIRNEQSYQKIYAYMQNNPEKWLDDKYYIS